MTEIRVSGVADFGALGVRWRDLEQRARCSFFQSWTWTGCLARERFPDPVLVEATEAGRTVALALFNRVRAGFGQPDLLCLGESGDPSLDCPYIEHNGVLAEQGREEALTEACLAAVARTHGLVLSGVGDVVVQAARRIAGLVWIGKTSESPFVGLSGIRSAGGTFLDSVSANTRQQVRRSDRFYASEAPLTTRISDSIGEAQEMLNRMEVLHQATWKARGRPGSFAEPFFGRFHRALIDDGLPRGQIALIEVSAAEKVIGILYNVRDSAGCRAYQSGFDYAAAASQAKPGLTCHHAAIRQALADGAGVYDFLAGDDRYKRSLSNGSVRQYWLEAGPAWSLRLLRKVAQQGLNHARVG